MDNYAAHKTPEVRDWLAANQRVQVRFTPTHASWMNVVRQASPHAGGYGA